MGSSNPVQDNYLKLTSVSLPPSIPICTLWEALGEFIHEVWLCLTPEFRFDKVNADPMAVHCDVVQEAHYGMERRV